MIRLRLQAKETALKRSTKKFFSLAASLEKGNVEEFTRLYADLMGEFSQYEFAVKKSNNVFLAYGEEATGFDVRSATAAVSRC